MVNIDKPVKKVLIIDLGQVGDVIMSFPALIAIREHFTDGELVVVAGKTPGRLVIDLGLADKVITIDRQGLLDGSKVRAVPTMFSIVREVRRERADLVIDLHSLYESNLLGFLSGAPRRLFANRRNRSLDILSNYRPRPPVYDDRKHLAEIYLDVLRPLGIEGRDRSIVIKPPPELAERFCERHRAAFTKGKRLAGLAIGAGHPSRRWALNKFAELARRLSDRYSVLVFLGPEEKAAEASIRHTFEDSALLVPDLSLVELAAAFSTLDLVIGNDTGTSHLGSATGTKVVMIADKDVPSTFAPLGTKTTVVKTDSVEKISVDDVWRAITKLME